MRLLAACVLLVATLAYANANALDDYVHRPDSAYGWTEIANYTLSGQGLVSNQSWTGYVVNMTSQRWLTDADFADKSESKSLWWHYLVVIVPSTIKYTQNASLYITGGDNSLGSGNLPTAKDEDVVLASALSMSNGIVVGVLFQIPNQRIIFRDDPKQQSRGEDAVIAYTWVHFHQYPDQPEWLVRFPMVKAALRAMDTITAFAASKFPNQGFSLDYYTVAGASKRGWTTWLVGAVDAGRTVGIVPIVLDAINFVHTIHHQYRSYGNWSFALKDYTEMNFMDILDSPSTLAMQQLIDPYFYRDRLTMPKFIVNALMDEFQQPDDTRYWWSGLPEPKHFLICPNAEHSEATGVLEIVPAIAVWMEYLLRNTVPIPTFTWQIDQGTGMITATLDNQGTVHSAQVWSAVSCGNNIIDGSKRRDFRVISLDNPCKCGLPVKGMCANLVSLWYATDLTPSVGPQGQRQYNAVLPTPSTGQWIAYIIMIEYENPFGAKMVEVQQSPQPKYFSKESAELKRSLSKAFHERSQTSQTSHVGDLPPIPIDLPGRLVFSTETSVWPPTFPYDDCNSETGPPCGDGLC